MYLRLLLCYALLLCSSSLLAQNDLYDLSQYKARYERRPGLELNLNSDFAGSYQTLASGGFNGSFSGNIQWFLNRNTDSLISNWGLLGILDIGRELFPIRPLLPFQVRPQNDNYLVALGALLRQDRYRRPNRFWGYDIELAVVDAGMAAASSGSNQREGALGLSTSLYLGMGRIEFAEDALLARWILQDLQTAGVTDRYTGDDVEALARTITDIIGNRVFDFRRRRIYELKQLQQTLLDRGITQAESFELFAILNDNWAFANRATLTHGNRFAYGVQTDLNGTFSRNITEDDMYRNIDNTYGAFADYVHSRIVPNNNGSHSFGARIDLNANLEEDEAIGSASLNYTRTWLPNSRTTFGWSNTLVARRFLTPGFRGDNPYFQPAESLTSSLIVNYFISYQWTFRLQASGQVWHRPAFTPDFGPSYSWLEERSFGFIPAINFSTNYFFF